MTKPWLSFYETNVPHEVGPLGYCSLADLFDRATRKYGDKPASTCLGQTTSYRELAIYADRMADYLKNDRKLKPGDRVAIMLPNVTQFFIAFHAVQKIGAIVVCTNPLYTPREMLHQFKDSVVETIIIVDIFLDKLETILAETKIKNVISVGLADLLPPVKRFLVTTVLKLKKRIPKTTLKTDSLRQIILNKKRGGVGIEPRELDDVALLQYTGGTTGLSKGAMLTHGNLLSNATVVKIWLATTLTEGEGCGLVAMPLYHIASLMFEGICNLMVGLQLVLIPQPIPIINTSKMFNKYRITKLFGVNTFLNALNNCPVFQKADKTSLNAVFSGGMNLQAAVAKKFEDATGATVTEAYGLSETSPFLTCNPMQAKPRPGSVGVPLISTLIKVVDEAGKEVATGETGEIVAQGPQIMKGYWNLPEETAQCLRDGWFWTGDIGKMDVDGFVYILDRRKDMILVSGFNVYPVEVEAVLASHPKVLEAAVIGIPDGEAGEAVKAFIVKNDPSLTAQELKEHCKTQLTNYKRPKSYEFRDSLPKTNVGKILRRELRPPKV